MICNNLDFSDCRLLKVNDDILVQSFSMQYCTNPYWGIYKGLIGFGLFPFPLGCMPNILLNHRIIRPDFVHLHTYRRLFYRAYKLVGCIEH